MAAGIAARCTALFTGPYAPATNYLANKQQSFSPVKGQLTYSYQYSNDPTLVANAGVRRKNVTIENNNPVYIYNQLGILNTATILQADKQGSVGAQTISVGMEGDKTVTLPVFLTTAMSEINANQPVGQDVHIGDASYTYDVNQNTANVSLTWVYNNFTFPTSYPN